MDIEHTLSGLLAEIRQLRAAIGKHEGDIRDLQLRVRELEEDAE
jgi:hypothetical protein